MPCTPRTPRDEARHESAGRGYQLTMSVFNRPGRARVSLCLMAAACAAAIAACARTVPREDTRSSVASERSREAPLPNSVLNEDPFLVPSATTTQEPQRDGAKDPFAKDMLRAAKDYKQWQRVDERAGSAPELCAYWPPRPSEIRRSEPTEEAGAHGRKLYYLYASDYRDYSLLPKTKATLPVGFTIVKESYRSVPLDKRTVALLQKDPSLQLDEAGKFYLFDRFVRPVDKKTASAYGLLPEELSTSPEVQSGIKLPVEKSPAGVSPESGRWGMGGPWAPPIRTLLTKEGWVRTGERKDLFVMKKVGDPKTAGTDHGWVYGVVSPEGDSVRQSGKLEHCTGCHEKAPHDRMFAPAGEIGFRGY